MLDTVLAGLDWATRFSDPLAWLVLAAFLATTALELTDRRERARKAGVAAWGLFGVFWFTLIYHFAFVQKSVIEGAGTLVAVPASFYVGYLLWSGRDSLFVLSRAVLLMGVVFFPFESVPALRQFLVETVTDQTALLISLVGSDPQLVTGYEAVVDGQSVVAYDGYIVGEKEHLYHNTFVFADGESPIFYTIIIACTGIGSMAIFAGLIAAVEAPLRRKLRALAVSIPVIYALNLGRNVMIAVGFGEQRFHLFPGLITSVFGLSDPRQVSYIVIDRIVAQSLSVVALVGITYLVVRELPEVLTIVEDLLFVVTGTEYDLRAALDVPSAAVDGDPEVGTEASEGASTRSDD
ncbi:archaeosortase A [Halosimplex rubrum]|uniref:Archaeosortase A n=1 Tax=Halosimplex rubrum TaxID=869889 RepID=A0A7D5TD24_9EURY|nr:archaeosortase A [Halosimplex rubrum]QLH77796.1 archaeosortase A [Halosimplex rubrum]